MSKLSAELQQVLQLFAAEATISCLRMEKVSAEVIYQVRKQVGLENEELFREQLHQAKDYVNWRLQSYYADLRNNQPMDDEEVILDLLSRGHSLDFILEITKRLGVQFTKHGEGSILHPGAFKPVETETKSERHVFQPGDVEQHGRLRVTGVGYADVHASQHVALASQVSGERWVPLEALFLDKAVLTIMASSPTSVCLRADLFRSIELTLGAEDVLTPAYVLAVLSQTQFIHQIPQDQQTLLFDTLGMVMKGMMAYYIGRDELSELGERLVENQLADGQPLAWRGFLDSFSSILKDPTKFVRDLRALPVDLQAPKLVEAIGNRAYIPVETYGLIFAQLNLPASWTHDALKFLNAKYAEVRAKYEEGQDSGESTFYYPPVMPPLFINDWVCRWNSEREDGTPFTPWVLPQAE